MQAKWSKEREVLPRMEQTLTSKGFECVQSFEDSEFWRKGSIRVTIERVQNINDPIKAVVSQNDEWVDTAFNSKGLHVILSGLL